MDGYFKPIYGSLQYPHIDYPFTDNHGMEITAHIAANLDAWMAASPNLDTLKKVAARAGVGFGTVQRARNGDGNTTIKNLTAIARAFGRSIDDLLRAPDTYPNNDTVTNFPAREPHSLPPLLADLVSVAELLSDRGQCELIGRAKEMAITHPRAKANPASC